MKLNHDLARLNKYYLFLYVLFVYSLVTMYIADVENVLGLKIRV